MVTARERAHALDLLASMRRRMEEQISDPPTHDILKAGDTVLICKLQSERGKKLNGKMGLLESFTKNKERWVVLLEQENVLLKCINLKKVATRDKKTIEYLRSLGLKGETPEIIFSFLPQCSQCNNRIESEFFDLIGCSDWKNLTRNDSRCKECLVPKQINELLIEEATKQGRCEVIKMLVDWNADININGADSDTALIMSISSENKDCFDLLLSMGADVNKTRQDGWTPLMQAVNHPKEYYVTTLLRANANVNAAKASGEDALSYTYHMCWEKRFKALVSSHSSQEFDSAAVINAERKYQETLNYASSYV